MQKEQIATIRDAFTVPAHIVAAANACRCDLMHGPTWSCIPAAGVEAFTDDDHAMFAEDLEISEGDTLAQTYCSAVADALRDFIDDLPSAVFLDWYGNYLGEREPEGEWITENGDPCDQDDDGAQWSEPEAYYEVSSSKIVEALFGDTIAREFRF